MHFVIQLANDLCITEVGDVWVSMALNVSEELEGDETLHFILVKIYKNKYMTEV